MTIGTIFQSVAPTICARTSCATTKTDEVVALMIAHNPVTANTTDATVGRNAQTPLFAAMPVGNVRMVQELVDFAPTSTATASAPKGNTAKRAAGSPGHRTAPRSSSPPRWAISTSSSSSWTRTASWRSASRPTMATARSSTSSRPGAEAAGGAGRPGAPKPWIAPRGLRRRHRFGRFFV